MRLAERRGDWAGVASGSLQLLQRAPDTREAYASAVTALVRSGEAETAERVARLYRERLPTQSEADALLAFALRAQGRLEDAEAVLDRASATRPDPSAPLRVERALLWAARGQPDAGIALLQETLAAGVETPGLQAALAGLLFATGNAEGGSRAAERALELDPEDPAPLALRARFLAATGRPAESLRDCDRYLERRPDDASIVFVRGAVLAELGRVDEAEAVYERAIELDERNFAARNNLALLRERRGDLTGALEAAQQAYALAESDPQVVDTLGWLYLQRGLTERSIALLERAHAANPDLASAQLHLALAYREAERDGDALRLLESLLERLPADAPEAREAHAALASLQR